MTKIQVDSNGKAIMLGGKALEAVGGSPVISSLNVTPTTSAQTITAPSGTDGYSPINVSAVTSSIDSNITAGNIKKDITILGITGAYEGSSGIGIPREVSANGVYQKPSSSYTFTLPTSATDIGYQGLYYGFNTDACLTSVDMSSLTSFSGYMGCSYCFVGCNYLTSIDLSNLVSISGYGAFYEAFRSDRSLSSVDLSSLVSVTSNVTFYNAFIGCTSLTSINLSSLTTVSGSSTFYQAFDQCTFLSSINLSSLSTINASQIFRYAFGRCTSLTSLSFPALTSTSFGSYTNQFDNMLYQVTGCTVHFPSNLQSVIGSWSSVTSGFGGTNTTVLFDLPATT